MLGCLAFVTFATIAAVAAFVIVETLIVRGPDIAHALRMEFR